MSRMRFAEISLPALKHNVRHIIEKSGGATLIAVVKANGYGHGAVTVAEAAIDAGASIIGVADLPEAFSLREGGIESPILSWLHGKGADFAKALQHNISLGVSRLDQLEEIAEAAKETGHQATIHLKLDTGLSRGGLEPDVWVSAFARSRELQNEGLICVQGIFSHLSNAGEEEDLKQANNFNKAVALAAGKGLKPALIHLASSAATFGPEYLHYNTVRVGLSIYGLSPFEGVPSAELGLQPAMTLKAEVLAVRTIEPKIGVSYNYIYRAERRTRLALIPIGYADGMPRTLNQDEMTVVVRGVRCKIVGRIAMDQCVIDLTPLGEEAHDVQVGEEVTLFGDPATGVPAIEEWAERMQTINYEIVARLGPRIQRININSGQENNGV